MGPSVAWGRGTIGRMRGVLLGFVFALACESGGDDASDRSKPSAAVRDPPSADDPEGDPAAKPKSGGLGKAVGSAVADARAHKEKKDELEAKLGDFDPRFVGKWQIEQWDVSYEIKLVESEIVVTGRSDALDEPFVVSDVKWEPPVLSASFLFASTGHETHSKLTIIDENQIRDDYTGDAVSVDTWTRVE